MREADAVIHAGDVRTAAALTEIELLGPPVHAVCGNVDDGELRRRLPRAREVPVGDRTVLVIHDAGPARGRLARLRSVYGRYDAVVFGHSHLPLHEAAGGFQIFNPGSPTERRRAPERSMGTLRLRDGELCFEHVWLGVA